MMLYLMSAQMCQVPEQFWFLPDSGRQSLIFPLSGHYLTRAATANIDMYGTHNARENEYSSHTLHLLRFAYIQRPWQTLCFEHTHFSRLHAIPLL